MNNSPLVQYVKLSPNNSGVRTHTIDRITPHVVEGQCTISTLGEFFSRPGGSSSNYGIDRDGKIGLFVPENRRSWCSSSNANDQRAVTVECASDAKSPYAVKEIVFKALVTLCADICKRNDKNRLIWENDKNKMLLYDPKPNEMVLTVHKWFADTTCPGEWMMSHLSELADEVNAILNPKPEKMYRVVCGSYRDYKNAETCLKAIQKAGYAGAFIVETHLS